MNLATRCTACGTMFRVVQDQLKVSEGWVRCGRCQAVFNAQENLFDLEHDTPPPWQPPAETADAAIGSASADDELAVSAALTSHINRWSQRFPVWLMYLSTMTCI